MKEIRFVYALTDIARVADEFLTVADENRHFAFYGNMGAGKTTFITAICKILGVQDLVSSPSFAIIHEYSLGNGEQVFHFDFYRIKKSDELLEIGFYEYCNANSYCFIEWPEKGEDLIPGDFIKVRLEEMSERKRMLSLKI
ncbi:MAG: tRNA (adenosine(37)-N6)-threonylcarbamoyltransferase complex ATPase subunit type 1 TsaE [Bacteroidales bacterium]|jgi:tRNA threonylcarbamoyladenosine biosynthesis protein TsaE